MSSTKSDTDSTTPSSTTTTTPSSTPSPLEASIIKQVDFYFSNSNLPKDKFLKGLYEKEEGGWVPIDVIASFKRMQSLTTDLTTVVNALKQSTFLKVSDDGTKVTRATPLPSGQELQMTGKNVIYAKGFPLEGTTIDSVTDFFKSKGNVLCVRLRRDEKKNFKGSVFVEFATEAEALAVAGQEHRLEGAEAPLKVITRAAWWAEKKASGKIKPDNKKGKKRKAETTEPDQDGNGTTENNKETKTDDGDAAADGGEDDGEEETETPKQEEKKEIVKNVVIRFATVGENTTRESLKEFVQNQGAKVRFVDFSKGEKEGFVRLADDDTVGATAVVQKAVEAKTELDGIVPQISALEGEEEIVYWQKIFSKQANPKGHAKSQRGGGRGGRGRGGRGGRGRGGRGRGNKRQRNN